MNDPMFAAVVSARLDPILAPRGFPYAAEHNGVSAPGVTRRGSTRMIRTAGEEASQRLARLGSAALGDWVDQLASMLDTCFSAMESGSPTTDQ